MKRIISIAVILLFTQVLHAQKNTEFYKHELKLSIGDSFTSWAWDWPHVPDGGKSFYANLSVSYLYRPVKWFWVGGNFVNFLGEKLYYDRLSYDFDGNITKFSKSKIKYCAIIAPTIRFSYRNTETITIYSALSVGIGLEDGYDYRLQEFPVIIYPYIQVTCFGISGNFGKSKNVFVGGEFGLGYGSVISVHGGYRF